MRPLFAVVFALSLASPTTAGDDESDWQKGLSPEVVTALERDGLVVLDEPVRQVFTPYVEAEGPVFVTSDAVLAAYHALFERSVIRLESDRARRLPGLLESMWAALVTPPAAPKLEPALVENALRRARVTVGTALLLLGEALPAGDAAARKLSAEEAKRVETATWNGKPAWLGPPDPGFLAIDYTRFRPRGFYDRNDRLRRFFRAVAWLQAIPFRTGRGEEFLGAVFLHLAVPDDPDLRAVLDGHDALLGTGDDISLRNRQIPDDLEQLEPVELVTRRRWIRETIRDGIAVSADGPSIRVIPAARTPGNVLFTQTAGGPPPGRCMPVGLEVAAMLGHAWSRSRLADAEGEEVAREADRMRRALSSRPDALSWLDSGHEAVRGVGMMSLGLDLHEGYLRVLAELLDAPEPDAPALFRRDAWQRKSAQTALAAWALRRHTWALRAKVSAGYLGSGEAPPGFVEPEPEFFGRLAALAEATHAVLSGSGVFEPAGIRRELAEAIPPTLRILEARRAELTTRDGFWKVWKSLTDGDQDALNAAHAVARALELPRIDELDDGKLERLREGLGRVYATLASPDRRLPASLDALTREVGDRTEDRWRALERLCRRLETLAHKQLRGIAFRESETLLLSGFGVAVSRLMGYEGEGYFDPKDDAPAIATVHHDPNTNRWLQVGVARPRPILVLYPRQGRSVLCRGAVLSYREFAAEKPLTDAEWKAMLDAGDAPDGPAWRGSIELSPR